MQAFRHNLSLSGKCPTNKQKRNHIAVWLSRNLMEMKKKVARVTGLEPATSGVTGRRSNQLSYTPARRYRYAIAVTMVYTMAFRLASVLSAAPPTFYKKIKHRKISQESQGPVLRLSLILEIYCGGDFYILMVGGEGLEPPTYSV